MPRFPVTRPCFLIVTPSYNQAQFIQQTIESVLRQKNIEVNYWVMDGKSSDRTVKILRQYGRKLNWVSKKDRGQTDAINQGIKKIQAQLKLKKTSPDQVFFAYINSDDYYLPKAFGQVARAFQKNPQAQWLVGDCQVIDETGREIQPLIRLYKKIWRWRYLPIWLEVLNPFPQPAVFLRWSAVQKLGFFDQKLRYVMDYEYWLRAQHQFGPPIFLDQPLAAFRIHQRSKGGSQFTRQFAEELQVAQKYVTNPISLLLHRVHNVLITGVYHLIK